MSAVNWLPGTHPSIPNAAWTQILALNGARKAYTIVNEEEAAGNVFRIARQGDSPDQRRTIGGVTLPEKLDIDDITLFGTDPVLVTIAGHGFETGDTLSFLAVGGATELNGNVYAITVVDEDTFTLNDTDSSDFSAYTSGGTVHPAPAMLAIGDITLSGTDPVLIEIEDHPFVTGDVVTFLGIVGTTGLNGNSYVITVVDEDTFTLDGTDSSDFAAYTSDGTAQIAIPVVVTIAEHGYATGDVITISGVVGATELNSTFTITKIDENTFSLDLTDCELVSDYTSGGVCIIPDATAGFALNPGGTVQCDFDALDRGPVFAYQESGGALTTLFVQEAN